jgi:preprotein translocase subunit SecG
MNVFVSWVVPTVHVVACIFLTIVVLLQTGKGADVGAVFGGGGSQTLFGASGAGNFLTRLTTGMAVAFMLTSLILTYGQGRHATSGLVDKLPAAAANTAAAPTAVPAGDAPAEPAGEPAPAPTEPAPAQ